VLQRLVEVAEAAHKNHEYDKDIQVRQVLHYPSFSAIVVIIIIIILFVYDDIIAVNSNSNNNDEVRLQPGIMQVLRPVCETTHFAAQPEHWRVFMPVGGGGVRWVRTHPPPNK